MDGGMKMGALHTLNSSPSDTVKGSSHPCKNLNISNPELKFVIYWQVHTILPFLPTINTQMNMIKSCEQEFCRKLEILK